VVQAPDSISCACTHSVGSRNQPTRERPPGCRTTFVGGVPDTMTEELLREMFEKCGTICSLRMSKKNFAHIRFEELDAVDKALFYSGLSLCRLILTDILWSHCLILTDKLWSHFLILIDK